MYLRRFRVFEFTYVIDNKNEQEVNLFLEVSVPPFADPFTPAKLDHLLAPEKGHRIDRDS